MNPIGSWCFRIVGIPCLELCIFLQRFRALVMPMGQFIGEIWISFDSCGTSAFLTEYQLDQSQMHTLQSITTYKHGSSV